MVIIDYYIIDMNRLLSRGTTLACRQRRSVAYRQDMPPPGGYGYQPWRRNIPTRGFGFVAIGVFGVIYIIAQRWTKSKNIQLEKEWMVNIVYIWNSKG